MIKINLLPIEKKQEELIAKQNLGLLIVVLGIFIIFAIIIIVLISLDHTIKTQITGINNNIENIKSTGNQYTEVKNKVAFIKDRIQEYNNLKNKNTKWPALFLSLTQNTPPTISLTSVVIDTKISPQVRIDGLATSRTEVIIFKDALEKSNIFRNMIFDSSAKQIPSASEKVDFVLIGDLAKN